MVRILIGLAVLLVAGPAAADLADLEEGLRRYAEADFAAALAALERAEDGEGLSRADVARLYEARANVHFALGDTDAARRALAALATVAPDHRLSAQSPPELHDMLISARASAPISLRVESTPIDGGVRLAPVVEGDSLGLVRRALVRYREGDSWREAERAEISASSVSYYAVAIGPGGAEIASFRTEDAPETWTGSGGDDVLPLVLGIGGGVLAAAIVVTIVAIVLGSSGGRQVMAPTVSW